jgi:hypothetical protein
LSDKQLTMLETFLNRRQFIVKRCRTHDANSTHAHWFRFGIGPTSVRNANAEQAFMKTPGDNRP